jgi:hypothetical protein
LKILLNINKKLNKKDELKVDYDKNNIAQSQINFGRSLNKEIK